VSLTQKEPGQWEIKQGSGGLVACVDPVMSKEKENLWLANIGLNMHHDEDGGRNCDTPVKDTAFLPSTNSIGLPLIRQAAAGVRLLRDLTLLFFCCFIFLCAV
jgi:hypothetical protein